MSSNAVVNLTADFSYGGTLLASDNSTTVNLDGHTLTLDGPDYLTGQVNGPGVIRLNGTDDVNNFRFFGGATLDVAGVMEEVGGNYPTFDGASVLQVDATGTWDILEDVGVSYSSTPGTIENGGLFEKTAGYGNALIYAVFDNTGALMAGPSGQVPNYPTISLERGGTLGGTLGGLGELDLHSAAYTLAPTTFNVRLFGIYDSSVVTLGANETYAGTFTLGGGTSLLLGGKTLTLSGSSGVLAAGVAGGVVKVTGTADVQSLFLNANATLDVVGLVTQDAYTTVDDTSFIRVESGATYDFIGDVGISSSNGVGTIDNIGLFEKTNYVGTSTVSAYFVNVGTLDAARGDIALYAGGSIGGTIAGNEVDFRGTGTYVLSPSVDLAVGTIAMFDNSATLLLGGDITYGEVFNQADSGGYVDLNGHTLTLSGDTDTQGAFVHGPGRLVVTGTLNGISPAWNGGMTVEVGNGGLLTQINQAYIVYFGGTADTGVLQIDAGGTYAILDDSGFSVQGTLTTNNAGLFEKTGNYQNSDIYGTFNNASTGTLDVKRGTISLRSGGELGGLITGAGELDLRGGSQGQYTLEAGAVVNVGTLALYDGGTSLQLAADVSFGGYLVLGSAGITMNGFTLTLTGNAYLSYYNINDGQIVVQGSADINNETIQASATLEDAGFISQDANIGVGNSTADTSALVIDSGATYDIITDSPIGASGTATVTNAGLFEKTGGTGQSLIYPFFNNTGTLLVAAGSIGLEGGGTLAGLLTGAGELDLRGGAAGRYTLDAAAVVNVATLGLYDGGTALFLSADATYAGRLVLSSAGIAMNGHTLTLTGSDYLGAYNLNDGVVLVQGSADISAGESIQANATLEDSGLITQDSYIGIGNSTADISALVVDPGATYDILTDSDISAQGTASIRNAGLFEKTGGTGISNIYPYFTNSGTLAVVAGELRLQGGGSLDGTVTGGGLLSVNGGTLSLAPDVDLSTLKSLSLYNGGALAPGGDLSYDGNFNLAASSGGVVLGAHTFTVTGAVNIAGYLTGPGTLKVTGSGSAGNFLVTGGAKLEVAGTLSDTVYCYVGVNGTDTASMVIDAGGTFDFLNDSFVYQTGTSVIRNAGLIEKIGASGQNGISEVAGFFTNLGTVLASAGLFDLPNLANSAGGTLTGGAWVAIDKGLGGTLELGGPAITTDAADIVLSGTGAEIISLTYPYNRLEQSLTTITGTLDLENGRNYVTANVLVDRGKIVLANSTLAAAGLTIGTGATLTGTGTVLDPVNNGVIDATVGTLVISDAVTGTGSMVIHPGAELVLGGSVSAGQTVAFDGLATLDLGDPSQFGGTLENLQNGDQITFNGTTATGAQIVNGDTLVVTLTGGQTIDLILGTSAPGLSVSIGPGGQVILSAPGGGATTVPPHVTPLSFDFGDAHVGDVLHHGLNVTNQGTVGSGETLDGSIGSPSVGVFANGSFTGLAPTAVNHGSLVVGLDTTFSGNAGGTAVASFVLDPSAVPVASDTVDVTGTIYAYATGEVVGGQTIHLAPVHVGTVDTGTLNLLNNAAPNGFAEALNAGLSGASAGLVTGGTVTGLVAGASSSVLNLAMSGAGYGIGTATTTLDLISDGTGIDTLGTTALAPQTVTVIGTFDNFATSTLHFWFGSGSFSGSGDNYTLNLGTLSQSGSALSAGIYVSNDGVGQADNLSGTFDIAGGTDLINNGFGPLTPLAPNGNTMGLGTITIDPTIGGPVTETIIFTPTSDLGAQVFVLAQQTLTIIADVLPTITPPDVQPSTIDFGDHHFGETVQQALTITNTATVGSAENSEPQRFQQYQRRLRLRQHQQSRAAGQRYHVTDHGRLHWRVRHHRRAGDGHLRRERRQQHHGHRADGGEGRDLRLRHRLGLRWQHHRSRPAACRHQ